MWYDLDKKEEVLNNASLMTAIKQDKKKVFILDGPSGCGKSYFIDHFAAGKTLRVPSNIIKETIFYTSDVRSNMEMLAYFLSMLSLDCIYIEDIDYSFGLPLEATQELLANIVLWLSKSYKVILTGIEISHMCKTFLECLHNQYRYFKFTSPK